jgi:hypothetical protein
MSPFRAGICIAETYLTVVEEVVAGPIIEVGIAFGNDAHELGSRQVIQRIDLALGSGPGGEYDFGK